MNDIDWSKAPDWATKHGFASDGAYAVWLSDSQYTYVDERQCGRTYSFAGHEGWSADEIKRVTVRPIAQGWTGEGLPPVEADVEIHEGPASWDNQKEWLGLRAKVVHVFKNQLDQNIATVEAGNGECACFIVECLRPIRTPEQITAEEQARVIDEQLGQDILLYGTCLAITYDDGTRTRIDPAKIVIRGRKFKT